MDKLKALFVKYKEIILYLVFGVLTTAVSWGTYAIFIKLFGVVSLTSEMTLAKTLSWVCAVIFAYITNKLWVFDSKSWKPSVVLKEVASFVGARIVTGVIEIAGLPLLVKIGLDQTIFGIAGSWANVVISVIVVILNYGFSKLLVFRKAKKESKEETNAE